jgi:outer membrane lipoprotein-sorting protein
VLVGNAAAFEPQLRSVGFGTFETVQLGELDLIAANFKRGGTRAGRAGGAGGAGRAGWSSGSRGLGANGWSARLQPSVAYRQAPPGSRPAQTVTAEEGAKAVALLDRVVAAKGGIEKLRTLKTIIATQTVISQTPTGPTNFDTTNYIQYPDRLRIETKTSDGANVQAFDGEQVWVKDQRGVREQPDAVGRQVRTSLRRDVVALLVAAKAGTLTPRILPDVKNEAGRVDHVLELSAPDLNPIVLYVDPESGLIDKLAFVDDAPTRPLVEERFSDYRQIDGIQIPFQGMRKIGSQSVERRTTDVKVNTPIDPSLFKRPTS